MVGFAIAGRRANNTMIANIDPVTWGSKDANSKLPVIANVPLNQTIKVSRPLVAKAPIKSSLRSVGWLNMRQYLTAFFGVSK